VRPSLHRVADPPEVDPGTSLEVDSRGTGIAPDAFVLVAGDGVTVSDITVVSPTEIRYRVTAAPSAPDGLRDVTVVNPGRYGIQGSGHIPAGIRVGPPWP
jgi:hypothetical protein